jgi:hypothetical protein
MDGTFCQTILQTFPTASAGIDYPVRVFIKIVLSRTDFSSFGEEKTCIKGDVEWELKSRGQPGINIS